MAATQKDRMTREEREAYERKHGGPTRRNLEASAQQRAAIRTAVANYRSLLDGYQPTNDSYSNRSNRGAVKNAAIAGELLADAIERILAAGLAQ